MEAYGSGGGGGGVGEVERGSGNSGSSEAESGRKSKNKRACYFPAGVFFIVGNKFLESVSLYGTRTILSIYLKSQLGLGESTATAVFHTFMFAVYFMPVFGAVLADQYIGKYRTILWLSVVYVAGLLVKTVGAAAATVGLPPVPVAATGLSLIAVGAGGIMPCVVAFGGDQFRLPEEAKQASWFFSTFYFALNLGALIATVATPMLREAGHCFGEDSCYPLAFGVNAATLVAALILFLLGKPFYTMNAPASSGCGKVRIMRLVRLICSGLVRRFIRTNKKVSSKKNKQQDQQKNPEPPKEHWLDYAEGPLYTAQEVDQVKVLLRILTLFVPIGVFWALFDQQGSRWTFQAERTDGTTVWDDGFLINPEHVQALNPLFTLALIPLFDRVVYPLCRRVGVLRSLLKRMIVGLGLTALAFYASGFLEIEIQRSRGFVPTPDAGGLHVLNGLQLASPPSSSGRCHLDLQLIAPRNDDGSQPPEAAVGTTSGGLVGTLTDLAPGDYNLIVTPRPDECGDAGGNLTSTVSILGNMVQEFVVYRSRRSGALLGQLLPHDDDGGDVVATTPQGFPGFRFLTQGHLGDNITFPAGSSSNQGHLGLKKLEGSEDLYLTPYRNLAPGDLRFEIDGKPLTCGRSGCNVTGMTGAIGTVMVTKESSGDGHEEEHRLEYFELSPPFKVHMLWMIPQMLLLTLGEVMLVVSGLNFSYSEAPPSMKSVIQAAWCLTVAGGNIIVAIVAEVKLLDQVSEFFMFGTLMMVVMFIMIYLDRNYEYVSEEQKRSWQLPPAGSPDQQELAGGGGGAGETPAGLDESSTARSQ